MTVLYKHLDTEFHGKKNSSCLQKGLEHKMPIIVTTNDPGRVFSEGNILTVGRQFQLTILASSIKSLDPLLGF